MVIERTDYVGGYCVRELIINEDVLQNLQRIMNTNYEVSITITEDLIRSLLTRNPEDDVYIDLCNTACPARNVRNLYVNTVKTILLNELNELMWDCGEIVDDETYVNDSEDLEIAE